MHALFMRKHSQYLLHLLSWHHRLVPRHHYQLLTVSTLRISLVSGQSEEFI